MKIANLFFAILLLTLVSCKGQEKTNTVTTSEKKTVTHATSTADKGTKIEVIDFYGTHRCVTCKAIEASAQYTIDTYFADEPKVIFKTVNVDDEANYDMAESYEATGTALFLNVIKNGVEQHIDLTDFAFSKGTDKEVFSQELKTKINVILKKM